MKSMNLRLIRRSAVHLAAAGCLLALLLTGSAAFAQSIDGAVKLYESADYKGAIAELDKVLADAKSMKEKALARAYYYRGQSKATLVRKNKEDRTPDMMKLTLEWAATGIQDLELAKKNDLDEKLSGDIAAATKKLIENSLELADVHLQVAEEGNKSAAEKKPHYEAMKRICEPIMTTDKFNYKAYDLMGDAQLFLGDSLNALKNYHFADDWFFRSAPKDGDMAIAYTYIHIAELEWALNHSYDNALKAIEEGKKVLDGEHKKIQSLGNRPPAEKAYLSQRHDIIMTDLNKAELDLKAAAGKR